MLTVHYAFFVNFLGLCLARKPATTSVPYSIPRVNNAPLFVITAIDAFPDKKWLQNFHKLSKEGCFNFVPTFPNKNWTEGCQKVELNLCKSVSAVTCCDFVPDISWNRSCFNLQVWIISWCCWWESGKSLAGEEPNWRYGLKIGGIKPSRSHGKPYQPTFKTIWQLTRKG